MNNSKIKLKNYNNLFGKIITYIVQGFLVAFVLTVLIGYLFGFRAYLVASGSSRPDIAIGSLIIDYKCPYSELQVGDYITFTLSKKPTTHRIVAIKPEGEYFEKGEIIRFMNNDIQYQYQIESKCQILTMASNYSGYEEDLKNYQNTGRPQSPSAMVENVSYSQFNGKVIYSLEQTGKILYFLRDNFVQIVVYVIILYLGMELFKFVPNYIKAF